MKNIIKFSAAILVLFAVLNCSKISEKVEEKVNEKVNERINEELKKVDSTLDKTKLDSMMKSLDSMKTKADSIMNDTQEKFDKDKKAKSK